MSWDCLKCKSHNAVSILSNFTCKVCGYKLPQASRPSMQEGVISSWLSKDGWVSAILHKGIYYYAGGSTQEEAVARLQKQIP